jgi:hypothetical protein
MPADVCSATIPLSPDLIGHIAALPKGIVRQSHFRLVVTLGALSLTGSSHAAQSIVDTWAPSAATCNAPPAITIGPKILIGEDFYCRIDTVSRKGSLVTWKGSCEAGDEDTRRTVFAKLSGKKLLYRYQGDSSWNGPYVRCRKQPQQICPLPRRSPWLMQ